jgi:drug/metabolite transporter (DMT)-like permease
MTRTAALAAPTADDAARGMALGALGVLIFAATLPMTRLAVGDAAAPQLPPAFVTAGRAAVAGLLSLAWLLACACHCPRAGTGARWPSVPPAPWSAFRCSWRWRCARWTPCTPRW